MAFDGGMVNPNIRLTFPQVLPDVSDSGRIQSTVVYGSLLVVMVPIAANI